MSDEKQMSDGLELEEKVAVGAVFLLAGWFLWQFLGNKDASLKLADTQSEVLEESSSRSSVRMFEDESTARVDQATEARRDGSALSVTDDAGLPVTAPVITAEKPELRQNDGASSRVLAPVTAITAPEVIVTETSSPSVNKEIVEDKVAAAVVDPVQPIAETVPPTIVAKSISTQVAPTIQPVSSDLSEGLLRLSGTGQPESHLQLLLNGRKASNLAVDAAGIWQYETNLEPGEYSIQVLSLDPDAQMGMQSALTRVTMPEPPAPVLPTEVDSQSHVDDLSVVETKPVLPVVVEADSLTRAAVGSDKKLNDRFYQVKYGDTLNKLSRRFKVSLRSLVRANNISDKDQIEIGQMLVIPGRE